MVDIGQAMRTVKLWQSQGLKNIRFSGGEPLLYPGLKRLVEMCHGIKRIAISSNGSFPLEKYIELIDAGVNDLSISLDGCCSMVGDTMSGVKGSWDKVVNNIRELSRRVYLTVGMVFTEENVDDCVNAVTFAHNLGVADIRVIPSAQFNKALTKLKDLPSEILYSHPILRYRINNIVNNEHVRGMEEDDSTMCHLTLDDMAVFGNKHYPCIIYMREGGKPIGEVGPNMREERHKWALKTNVQCDPICKSMCLDVCRAYNNKVRSLQLV